MTFPSSSHHNKSQLDSLAARSCRSPLSHKRWARAVRCGHQGPRPDDCLVISDEKGPDFGCLIFFLFLGSIIIFPWFSRFFPHLFFPKIAITWGPLPLIAQGRRQRWRGASAGASCGRWRCSRGDVSWPFFLGKYTGILWWYCDYIMMGIDLW